MKKILVGLFIVGIFLLTAGVALATPFDATMKSSDPRAAVFMPGFGNVTVHTNYWLESAMYGILDAFCVQAALAASGTFNLIPVPDDPKMQLAAWYAEQYWTGQYKDLTKADFQVAIWYEVIPNFYWHGTTEVGSKWTQVKNLGSGTSSTVSYAQIDGYQDFLVNKQPVPEPATMLLLGMGLIGLTAAGRKKLRS